MTGAVASAPEAAWGGRCPSLAPYVPGHKDPRTGRAPREGSEVGSPPPTNMLRMLPGDAAHHGSQNHISLLTQRTGSSNVAIWPGGRSVGAEKYLTRYLRGAVVSRRARPA